MNALVEAIRNEREDVVRQLLDGDVTASNLNEALLDAVTVGHVNIIRLLLAKGANVNASVLVLAIMMDRENEDVVRLILDHGADVNERIIGQDPETPLSNAILYSSLNIVRLLLNRGADVNVSDSSGFTPLIEAVIEGRGNVVRLILEKGANINARSDYGETALIWATIKGYEDIVKLLIENGANVNIATAVGTTALMLAEQKGFNNIIRLLRTKTSQLFPSKKRTTTDWMDICDSIGNARLSELRRIVRDGVKESNFQRVKKYFEYTESLQGFLFLRRLLV
jgi:FOG: Ankyrin repeat